MAKICYEAALFFHIDCNLQMIYCVIWQQHKICRSTKMKKKEKKKKKEEEKHTILSYVGPYKATFDQYVFSWPSAEIQAGQSHFLKAGVSDKPIREQKHS